MPFWNSGRWPGQPWDAVGEIWSYSSQSSARNGRWNHIAWSERGRLDVESDEHVVRHDAGRQQGEVARVRQAA
jgi:hypothetical protein